jgi:DNA-binding NarL/FixJ family response regulator
MKVLVVDDADEIRGLFRTALRVEHPEVELAEADSAETALELVIDLRPDAVIVDAVMPGMDGLELVGQLHRVCPQTRIVMFSSLPHGEAASRARAEGAEAFVEKSQGFEAALEAIGLDSAPG